MKLLLDTHIWFWTLAAPANLSARVAAELVSRENEIWLSPISVWEAMLLMEKGRVVVPEDPVLWINDALHSLPCLEAPLTTEVALQSRQLKLQTRDPADRFIVATAKVYDLTLVTSDKKLLKTREVSVLANR